MTNALTKVVPRGSRPRLASLVALTLAALPAFSALPAPASAQSTGFYTCAQLQTECQALAGNMADFVTRVPQDTSTLDPNVSNASVCATNYAKAENTGFWPSQDANGPMLACTP